MLTISEIFKFSGENFYFERIRTVRMVRMVRMVRSRADRTFQLCVEQRREARGGQRVLPVAGAGDEELPELLRERVAVGEAYHVSSKNVSKS